MPEYRRIDKAKELFGDAKKSAEIAKKAAQRAKEKADIPSPQEKTALVLSGGAARGAYEMGVWQALRELGQHSEVKLILTDVMMPEMDGIELFRHIRNNINYSHIPVILLTAKSGEENIISGLKEGAADYITKPYSLEVLRLRIKKIMQWTENAYNQVGKGFDISPSEITVSSLDEELVSRVMESIEANMQNPSYSVVQLSNDVNMTRGHLYKKLMAITGKSPLEFIRIVKIKRGKSLLDQGRRNVSEVADRVGLSPKQFSYYFKNIYGETPSEYLKNNK